MSQVWLIVLAVVVPVMILVISYYILVYYQHPEDRSTSYFSKAVVLLGLALAMLTVLMIPFDVANQGLQFGCGQFSSICGGLLGIEWIWQILFLIVAFFIVALIPFTLFYYESFGFDNKSICRSCFSACGYQIFFTAIGVAVFLILYAFIRFTDLPVIDFEVDAQSGFQACTSTNTTCDGIVLPFDAKGAASSSAAVRIETPFLVFLPGFLGFIGWFLFAIYCGIGLVALPLELIRAFVYRPQYIPSDQYARLKLEIQRKIAELMQVGERLRESSQSGGEGSRFNPVQYMRSREERRIFNEFKQSVVELEDSYNDLKLCHENWRVYNPLIPYFKLVFGVLGAIISLLWILHTILYNLARTPYGPDGTPTSYFLNTMFTAASKEIGFTLVGTVLIGVFAFYLLFATMKGNEIFGLRFFICEIHPMKYGGTYMNSFLVNLSLLLFCIPPLIQFVATSLSEYVVVTDLDAIFGQQIRFLIFFEIFFANNVFIIMMLSVAVITLFAMLCFPNSETARRSRDMAKRLSNLENQAAESERAERQAKLKRSSEGEGAGAGATAGGEAMQQV